jgi:molybdenum cofactor cytidylyltransferase
MGERAENRIGTLVLAAGGSTRMGTPKQLLVYEGKSLVRRATEAALGVGGPVVVVVGASADAVSSELAGLAVRIVPNERWQAGMGGSIRCGLEALDVERPDLAAVVITLCDQPLVGLESLARLVRTFESTGAPLVASSYGAAVGVPALFARELFGELRALDGATGARSVVERHRRRTALVDCPEGATDLDTPDAYERLTAG